jgi:hypothetical protein
MLSRPAPPSNFLNPLGDPDLGTEKSAGPIPSALLWKGWACFSEYAISPRIATHQFHFGTLYKRKLKNFEIC